MIKISPVLRLLGSKYRLFNELYQNFKITENKIKNFYDVFGGTGIVAVNVKNLHPELNVHLNDYDKIFPLDFDTVADNQQRFNGYGSYSELSIKQWNKKLNNNFIEPKLEPYNKIVEALQLSHQDYKDLLNKTNFENDSLIYLDPPYFSDFKAYKNKINIFEFLIP